MALSPAARCIFSGWAALHIVPQHVSQTALYMLRPLWGRLSLYLHVEGRLRLYMFRPLWGRLRLYMLRVV